MVDAVLTDDESKPDTVVVNIDLAKEVHEMAVRMGLKPDALALQPDITYKEFLRAQVIQYYKGRDDAFRDGFVRGSRVTRLRYGSLGLALGITIAILSKPALLAIGSFLMLVAKVTL